MLSMTYSVDLRKKVVAFIASGGSKAEASRRFGVARSCIFLWLERENLEADKHPERRRKIDKAALLEHVDKHPDAMLKEIAEEFGVSGVAIWKALKKQGIRRKKNVWIYSKVCP